MGIAKRPHFTFRDLRYVAFLDCPSLFYLYWQGLNQTVTSPMGASLARTEGLRKLNPQPVKLLEVPL